MPHFHERPLRRYTLPLALLLGAGMGLLLPANPRLENALNRVHASALDPRLLLVRIDDATLTDYGLLHQWPRQLYVRAIDTLEQAGAAVIGLDVVLSPANDQNAAVQRTFSLPNLVLATAPGDIRSDLYPDWKAVTGVSALNNGGGAVRQFQTAYVTGNDAAASPRLTPSFARQVAAHAGYPVPLDTRPRLLRYTPVEEMETQVVSFRDLINGNVRYADLQGCIVLIGQDASGVAGVSMPDIDGRSVSGLTLQARAVSSLMAPPFRHLPRWATVLLCAALAGLAVLLGGLWAYALASLTLLTSVILWNFNVVFPGVTVSLAVILAASLLAFERWWQLRTLRVRDQLTGLGNRLAFTRAVEQRWLARREQPFALALVDLSGLRRVNDTLGRPAGDALLREVASRLQRTKRRNDLVFRWGGDEFALLLDQVGESELQAVSHRLEQALTPLSAGQIPIWANVGVASSAGDRRSPSELIEAASRQRYRAKYQRVQEG